MRVEGYEPMAQTKFPTRRRAHAITVGAHTKGSSLGTEPRELGTAKQSPPADRKVTDNTKSGTFGTILKPPRAPYDVAQGDP